MSAIAVLIENNPEFRDGRTVIICYRTIIIYVTFILGIAIGAFAAGYTWRSIESEHPIKVEQITVSLHEFTAKNEKQHSSIRIAQYHKEYPLVRG